MPRDVLDTKIYTLKELMPIIGVSYRTLLTYVQKDRIKAVKIGKNWQVTEENLKRFLSGE